MIKHIFMGILSIFFCFNFAFGAAVLPADYSQGDSLPFDELNQIKEERTGDLLPISQFTREYIASSANIGSATYPFLNAYIDTIDGTISTNVTTWTCISDNNWIFSAYAGKNITLESVTFDGGVVAGIGDLTVDSLNLNANALTSTSGGISITPLAGQVLTLDEVVAIDGLSWTSVNNNNWIFSAYAGKNITLESVTFDGGVVAGIGDLTVDNLNLNGNTASSTGSFNIDPSNSQVYINGATNTNTFLSIETSTNYDPYIQFTDSTSIANIYLDTSAQVLEINNQGYTGIEIDNTGNLNVPDDHSVITKTSAGAITSNKKGGQVAGVQNTWYDTGLVLESNTAGFVICTTNNSESNVLAFVYDGTSPTFTYSSIVNISNQIELRANGTALEIRRTGSGTEVISFIITINSQA